MTENDERRPLEEAPQEVPAGGNQTDDQILVQAQPSNNVPEHEVASDPISFAFARALGQWLTPLIGKAPVLGGWQSAPPATEDDVLEWREIGYNLGFRTGARSGFTVIDDDQARHGVPEAARYVPPPTGLISESPTGGRHYYYVSAAPCPGNSASRLAPHVDVRGEGGQVVYPGSVHPVERRPYRWVLTGEPGVMPEGTLEVLRGSPANPALVNVDTTRPALAPSGHGYAETALVREAARVRAATEGMRNEVLNAAAFNLGQLVAGGALPEQRVRDELTAAAMIAGLEPREIAATIRSGLAGGAKQPRGVPERANGHTGNTGAHVEPRTSCGNEGALDLLSLHLTHLSFGRLLVRRHGADLRHCHPWEKWLVWDGTRWKEDQVATVEQWTTETQEWLKQLVEEAFEALRKEREGVG